MNEAHLLQNLVNSLNSRWLWETPRYKMATTRGYLHHCNAPLCTARKSLKTVFPMCSE